MRVHRTPIPLLISPSTRDAPMPAPMVSHPPFPSPTIRSRFAPFAISLALLLLPGVNAASAQSNARWVVRSSAATDLWFHSVALTGFDAYGAIPLYAPGYATQVRTAREEEGKGLTRLEREAPTFRAAFAGDRDFEVLHFVPIYFAAADVDQMLDALAAVAAEGESAAAKAPPAARFGAAAVASVLKTPAQRAILARFAAAVRDEWATAYRAERAAQSDQRDAALRAAVSAWAGAAGPAASSSLAGRSLDGGLILASPPLGQEGRLFAGRPGDREDNVVAVHLAFSPVAAGDPAWLAVREMAFPAAREALAAAGLLPTDPGAAELATGRAAAHLGALWVGGRGDGALDAYRRALLRVAGKSVPAGAVAIEHAFDATYPLTAAATRAIGELRMSQAPSR